MPNGIARDAAAHFQISTRLVTKIWTKGRECSPENAHEILKSFSPKRKGRVGRKSKEILAHVIKAVPIKKRRTVRALAKQIGVPKSTLQDAVKAGKIKRHSNSLKPELTEENKIDRLRYCLRQIIPETINDNPLFRGFYDVVHVDEKWFYITEVNQRCLLMPDEEPPHRTTKSKKFIAKLMFLCAVARPRFHPETGECVFDGKIGIWPFIERVAARRNSANRPRGTIEIKAIEVDRDVYREKMIDNVLPAILAKFPDLESPITIQQDNARPHIYPNDPDFMAAAAIMGVDLRLENQVPNSPDQNINDLGFFNSVQSCQQEETAANLQQLIDIVTNAYAEYSPVKLNKVWVSYQQCMIETLKIDGGNKYKLPHMGKDRLIQRGELPESLNVPIELVTQARGAIQQAGLQL